ncbi:Sau3AI family type II restriction endonuclease [Methanobrevibacter sp.]|uniref:Sau3AI family type II restriction endonuclease n=1 Tax=Methanobrevibacter sp. TaxID=66852 RepID=UPI00388D93E0
MKFQNETELLEYTSNIKGKTFKEIDSKNLLDNSSLTTRKGLLGQVVETGFYNYPLNNDSRADFEELGIELKVTGYVKNKNGSLRAKERLSLSMINFNEIVNETFESSHVLGKCKKMLIIWYEYNSKKEAKDFLITDYQLYDMTKDFEILNNDFEIIKAKVLEGKAHELSEGDTSYLGACTKSNTSANRTTQPFSDILPKPRAYSLKNAYMTGILREHINPTTLFDFKPKQTEFKTVMEYVENKLKPYFGKTQAEIYEEITNTKIEGNMPKNIGKMISDRIIGKDGELPEKNELFRKTSYFIKNISLNKNGTPKERLSFRNLRHDEFNVTWDESEWKQFFEEQTFIIICYKIESDEKNGYRKLHSVKKISFTGEELDLFEKTFNQIKVAINKKDNTLLPVSSNGFKDYELQLAPKGDKGANAYETFFESNVTKTCFMINKKLIKEKLEN